MTVIIATTEILHREIRVLVYKKQKRGKAH